MKEQFVTYEIALKLKQLGFDEKCLGFFTPEDNKFNLRGYTYYVGDGEILNAPLWQQAFDWFKEKYKLFGNPYSNHYLGYKWQYSIHKLLNDEIIDNGVQYETYEESRITCLEKLIELINE